MPACSVCKKELGLFTRVWAAEEVPELVADSFLSPLNSALCTSPGLPLQAQLPFLTYFLICDLVIVCHEETAMTVVSK